MATIAYRIGGVGLGTYAGSAGTILVIGLITRLFQVLLGPPALFVSLAISVFLNIPRVGTDMLRLLARMGVVFALPLLPVWRKFARQRRCPKVVGALRPAPQPIAT